MAKTPIDTYLAEVPDPTARKTLTALRMQLRKLLPTAEETLSYGMPAFKVEGATVVGFAFFSRNCGFYPYSGTVVPALKEELAGYKTTKSGITFAPDAPLPAKLVKRVVDARLAEIAGEKKPRVSTKALVTERVTDAAVKEATGRDWKAWMRALDKANASELDHKQLVALLAREVESSWWQQSIAVAYEQARGKRVVGETSDTGFQVGVVRTLPATAEALWTIVAEQPQRWLGAGARWQLEAGQTFEVPKRRGVPGVRGEIRVVKPGQRLRLRYQQDGWKTPAVLNLTVTPKKKGAAIQVQMEKLPDADTREKMREHWSGVLENLMETRKT